MTRLVRSLISLLLVVALAAPLAVAAQEESFDPDGVSIAYTDMGIHGEPVGLIHSFLSSSDMWTNTGSNRLLAPLGHG